MRLNSLCPTLWPESLSVKELPNQLPGDICSEIPKHLLGTAKISCKHIGLLSTFNAVNLFLNLQLGLFIYSLKCSSLLCSTLFWNADNVKQAMQMCPLHWSEWKITLTRATTSTVIKPAWHYEPVKHATACHVRGFHQRSLRANCKT